MTSWADRAKTHFSQKRQEPTAETAKSRVSAVLAVPSWHISKKHTFSESAANDQQPPDPDRWAWPNGTAANTAELDLMTRRLATFARLGLSVDDAERMADKLQQRDREGDDRRSCVECGHLSGRWSCRSYRQRGATGADLPADYVQMLTRCNAWRAAA